MHMHSFSFLQRLVGFRNRGLIAVPAAILSLALVSVSCGGETGSAEDTEEASSALASANWVSGLVFDSISVGPDSDDAPVYPCRSDSGVGMTRSNLETCEVFPFLDLTPSPYETLTATWIDASGGAIPSGALVVGKEPPPPKLIFGQKLYACRASFAGGLQLGKITQNLGACVITYGGQEVAVSPYQVLVQSTLPATFVPGAPFPDAAIIGGYESDGTPLYVCNAVFQRGVYPGKTHRDWGSCDIDVGGSEQWVTDGFSVVVPSFVSVPIDSTISSLPSGFVPFLADAGNSIGICTVTLPPIGGVFSGGWVYSNSNPPLFCAIERFDFGPDGEVVGTEQGTIPVFKALATP